MEIHGIIALNLRLAVESSRRLAGHPIHADTLQFWADLIKEARATRVAGELDDTEVASNIAELESVFAERAA